MDAFRAWAAQLGNMAENAYARMAHKLDERFGREPAVIVPYRGYGRANAIVVRGRVLDASSASVPASNESVWANLLATYQRFETDEIPFAPVRASCGGVIAEVQTDREGFFIATLLFDQPLPNDQLWHSVALTLLAPPLPNGTLASASAEACIPPADARFGVISDIDDTLIQTDATHLLRAAREVLLGNAHTRLPFPGVAALYRALHQGAQGPFVNPIFYVSSSPWNLYGMLEDMFELREIPRGPLFLRDWGLTPKTLPIGHRTHKLAVIRELLEFYPDLPFLLIGDSGQEDPEIYAEIVREFPERILAMYIRKVTEDSARSHAINALAEQLVATGGMLILADDTAMIARHAASQGWIDSAALPAIEAEKQIDTTRPSL